MREDIFKKDQERHSLQWEDAKKECRLILAEQWMGDKWEDLPIEVRIQFWTLKSYTPHRRPLHARSETRLKWHKDRTKKAWDYLQKASSFISGTDLKGFSEEEKIKLRTRFKKEILTLLKVLNVR